MAKLESLDAAVLGPCYDCAAAANATAKQAFVNYLNDAFKEKVRCATWASRGASRSLKVDVVMLCVASLPDGW